MENFLHKGGGVRKKIPLKSCWGWAISILKISKLIPRKLNKCISYEIDENFKKQVLIRGNYLFISTVCLKSFTWPNCSFVTFKPF